MKLHNRTKVPDELLEPLLAAAARAVGARYAKVPIKVTQGHNCGSHGEACKVLWVKLWVLNGKSAFNKRWDREIICDGGYLSIVITNYRHPWVREHAGPYTLDIFELMIHEFAHIKDFQTGRSRDLNRRSYCKSGTRKLPWIRRPIEISAINQTNDALTRGVVERNLDALMRLACWLASQPEYKPQSKPGGRLMNFAEALRTIQEERRPQGTELVEVDYEDGPTLHTQEYLDRIEDEDCDQEDSAWPAPDEQVLLDFTRVRYLLRHPNTRETLFAEPACRNKR